MLWVSESPGLWKTGRFNKHLPLQLPPCVWTDCRMEWVEVDGGQQAGMEGAASLTQNSSLLELHHMHLSDPLPVWLGRRKKVVAEIAKRGTDTESPQVGKKKKAAWWELRGRARERDKGREGGRKSERVEGDVAEHNLLWFPFARREPRSERQCEIFREGPGTETRALSDVTQLQCWNNAHRTVLCF